MRIEEAIIKAATDAFQKWSISREMLLSHTPMTRKSLAHIIDTMKPPVQAGPFRWIPTSFNPDDPDLRAFPRPFPVQWNSLTTFIKQSGSLGVMSRLPIFWQANFALFQLCRDRGIPLFVNEPENIPLGAIACKAGGIDAVVSFSPHIPAFIGYIREQMLPWPHSWFIIHNESESEWLSDVPHSSYVQHEVHILPGVPILEQCGALAAASNTSGIPFHVSSGFMFEKSDLGALFTSIAEYTVPLIRFSVDFRLVQTDTCQCGLPIFKRIV